MQNYTKEELTNKAMVRNVMIVWSKLLCDYKHDAFVSEVLAMPTTCFPKESFFGMARDMYIESINAIVWC